MACEFRILAAESGWNDEAPQGAFRNALTEILKDELVSREEPNGHDKLISLTILIDNRLCERRRERGGRVACPITSAVYIVARLVTWSPLVPRVQQKRGLSSSGGYTVEPNHLSLISQNPA